MATVNELYGLLEKAIPKELSCEWDNDGRMVVPSPEKQVKRLLICLDVTAEAVDYAAENGFDCIVSHHPLVFHPLKNVDAADHISRKVCRLIKHDIAVLSFHTRLDKVSGGVNDALADALGLKNISEFSDVGRMGEREPISLDGFCALARERLCADRGLACVDSGRPVSRVALVGGSGKDYLEEAVAAGCDTFVTGEVSFNREHDAKEMGLNLVCGGHYFTENVVCERLKLLVDNFGRGIYTEIMGTNPSVVK